MLEAGFTVRAADGGREVRFGLELKGKLDRQPDGAARKERLPMAREAVRSGTRRVVEEKGEAREYYGKVFRESEKQKGMLVIVDATDGYAFNYYPLPVGQMERKLRNREGDEPGERPPVVVLQAMVPLLAACRIDNIIP